MICTRIHAFIYIEFATFMHLLGDRGSEESVFHLLKQAHDYRKTAETAAKDLLVRLDGSCGGIFTVTDCNVQPWESLSSNSHTRYSWCVRFIKKITLCICVYRDAGRCFILGLLNL